MFKVEGLNNDKTLQERLNAIYAHFIRKIEEAEGEAAPQQKEAA